MNFSRLALAVALTPGLAFAADGSRSVSELPPLVITRATALQAPAPASVAVIDRAQIEASAASSLVDVLRSQAGVQIRDTLGDGSRVGISLRGFGENTPNNTLVLVDGRRLNQPALAGPDLNSIPLANIQRIEIVRGAGTVLYGDQAVGGVINIVTRTPNEREAYIEASRGSHDLEAYRGHIFQPLGAGFSLYASGETRNADNYRDHNEASYDNAFVRLRYEHASGHALYEYQTLDDELRLPGYLTEAQRRVDRQASYAANGNGYNDSKTQVHRFALEQQLNAVWTANFDYSHSDQDSVGAYNSAWGESPFTQGTRIESFSPRLNARFDSALGASEWLLGHDHIASDYEYLSTLGDTVATQTLRDWYSQFSQGLGHGLTLTLGYRASEVEDDNQAADLKHDDREESTSVALNWQATAQTRLFIKREEVLRWANVDENNPMYLAPGVEFLKPQTGESWEGGVEWDDGEQRYQLSVYRLDLDDELMYDALSFVNTNLDQTRRDGMLLEAQRRLTTRLSVGGQYSFTDGEYRDGSFKGKDIPWVARHTASTHLAYELLPGLKSYVEAVYTGARHLAGDDGNVLPKEGGYVVYNAALRYDYQQFTGKLRVNNLTGKQYDSYASYANWVDGDKALYPAPEEVVQLSVGYRF